MPVEWALSIVVPIFMRKGDYRNFSCYGDVKLLVRGTKLIGVRKKSLWNSDC